MHYPDLTSSFYETGPEATYVSNTQAYYVGWLAPEEGHEVPTGPAPEGFVEALNWAVQNKGVGGPFHDGDGYRGFHSCALSECPGGRGSTGSFDVTIPSEDGGYFVPALIGHYVEHHQYLPPAEFVECVLNHWQKRQSLRESQGTRGVIRRMLNG